MKGHASQGSWYVAKMADQHYLAERTIDSKYEWYELRAHCLACAKLEVLIANGGLVDLRGWQKQGSCGLSLRLAAPALRDEIEAEKRKEDA